MKMTTLLTLLLLMPAVVFSQDEKDMFSMSLEELLNLEISVATKTKLKTSDAPAVVTVITSDQIRNSGARDLIDVLRLVPGFDFGSDVQGVVGIGVRGNWGHEGKVLLLWDGMEMNEIMYSTLQFGNHYPIEHIKQIEIIRGPGSAIYGGYAELAVINVVTRDGKDINGVSAAVTYGQTSGSFARRNIGVSYGKAFDGGQFKILSTIGQGTRSDETYNNLSGESYAMKNASALNPFWIEAEGEIKDFKATMIVDRFHTTERDEFDDILSRDVNLDFNSYIADLQYNAHVGAKMVITPRFNVKYQQPWRETSQTSTNYVYERDVVRYTGQVTGYYDFNSAANLVAGLEYYKDQANSGDVLFSGNKRHLRFSNIAAFAQGIYQAPWANITLGARLDHHSEYGNSFAPRLGLTKVIDPWHFKVLVSQAFRSPAIENIDVNRQAIVDDPSFPEIKPERTLALELEAGYSINADQSVSANLFDLQIKHPIVYFYDVAEGYKNFDQIETRGIELDYRLRKSWGNAEVTYSFYTVGKNRVTAYRVPAHSGQLLGFSPHKFSAQAAFQASKSIVISPSAVLRSGRYGYFPDGSGGKILKKTDVECTANLFIRYRDLMVSNLDLGVGVYDILNVRPEFIQPYDSDHAPLPGSSREFLVQLSYRMD